MVARGDFSGNISAQDYLGNVRVLGTIDGDNWNVGSQTDSAIAKNIYARKGIDIDNLLVEGSLRSLTSGSKKFRNGLAGNLTADSIRNVRVYGDLDAIIRANSDFGRWSVTGDILDGAHIYEADVELTQ